MTESQQSPVSVRLFIYSGRPDPEWPLSGQVLNDLTDRVRRAIGGQQAYAPPPGGLGYRGFLVRNREGIPNLPREFTVFGGVISEGPGPESQHWRDTTGVEQLLLQEARERGYGRLLEAVGIPPAQPE